jgi:hypothetical protein
MPDAVEEYARYRASPDAWALGRFVVALSRLDELGASICDAALDTGPWPCSVVAAADLDVTTDMVRNARDRVPHRIRIEALELRDTPGLRARLPGLANTVEVYVEVTPDDGLDAAVASIGSAGARAKIRTGGVTPEAFPAATDIVRFLRACHRHGVPFKATAGLHHPVRGEYRLTYDARSDSAIMFGYVNVMLAAALVLDGRDDDTVLGVLTELSPGAFVVSGDALQWRESRFDRALLERTRARFMAGFGSCSFREPLDELPPSLAVAA